jgi:hypothetical protein
LSHEMGILLGAETVFMVERNMTGAAMRGASHPAGVKGHITRKRITSEPGISRVRPAAKFAAGPHWKGEEP